MSERGKESVYAHLNTPGCALYADRSGSLAEVLLSLGSHRTGQILNICGQTVFIAPFIVI